MNKIESKKRIINTINEWALTNKKISAIIKKYDIFNSNFLLEYYLVFKKMHEQEDSKEHVVDLDFHEDGEPKYTLELNLKNLREIKGSSNLILQEITISEETLKTYVVNQQGKTSSYKENFQPLNAYKKAKEKGVAKGVYYFGEQGIGKTHLIFAVANHILKKQVKTAVINLNNLYSHTMKSFSDNSLNVIVDKLKKVEVLFLDDIGSEPIKLWFCKMVLFPILNARVINKKDTFFTSNYSLNRLQKLYSNGLYKEDKNAHGISKSIVSRIKNLAIEIHFKK